MPEPRWIQYQVFAEARLNFSRQFMQVVAFMLGAALAGAALFRDAGEPLRSWLLLGGGLTLAATAFVAHRIRRTEDAYERLLAAIETEGGTGLVQPRSARLGAKTVVAATLLLTGLGVSALALLRLAG